VNVWIAGLPRNDRRKNGNPRLVANSSEALTRPQLVAEFREEGLIMFAGVYYLPGACVGLVG
jgi:hypothetical protein